jgi:hypothetical protein
MDDIVRQALAKWPNVPHCYHWLALDARGVWRMRDEKSQAAGLPGDKILRTVLIDFINRNYTCDQQGRWYFQNGPQRVYVDLEATPYIARTDPVHGFMLHTGEPLRQIDAAWMTKDGQLILEFNGKAAQVDDRDLAACTANLRLGGHPVADDRLLGWLKGDPASGAGMSISMNGRLVELRMILPASISAHFGFMQRPEPDPA